MGNKKDEGVVSAATELRNRAEERMRTQGKVPPLDTEEALRRLVHELEVHQIELEIQNEELNRARSEAESALGKYTELYDFAPVGYATLDRKGVIREANLTCASLLAVERSRLLGKPFRPFVAADQRSAFDDFLQNILVSNGKETSEMALRTAERQSLIVQIEAVTAASGVECHLALIDITSRKQTEDALRESEARMYQLAGMAEDAIVMLDDGGTVTFCNAAAERLFDCSAAEMTGSDFHRQFLPERLHDVELQGYARFKEQGTGPFVGRTTEVPALRRDGTEFMLELSISALKLHGQWHAIGIMRDVTVRKELEASLRHDSTHDSLTGLYNRAFFDEELERFAHGRMFPLSIVIADLNDLKIVNDTQGHEAGDALLRSAARMLLHTFRGEDIVARIGGDEFAILLPATEEKVALEAVIRIKHSPEVRSALLKIAFGIACATNREELADAMRLADERMYLDKATQKDKP